MNAIKRLILFPGFTPLQLPGLAAWYVAGRGMWQDSSRTTPAVADGDPVGAWDDLSDNGRNVLQATAGSRPILKTNIQNGLPVVRFTATQFLQRTFGAALSQPFTQMTVASIASIGAAQTFTDGKTTASVLVGCDTSNWRFAAGGAFQSSSTALALNKHIIQSLFNGTASTFRIDGGASPAYASPGSNTLDGLTLGVRGDGTTQPLTGDICESFTYSGALSNANLNLLGSYLAYKWGLTWTPVS